LVAHFKRTENGLQWDDSSEVPASAWFKKYYTEKAAADNKA